MNSLNDDNQTLLNSLEKRGLLEMTKAYFRTSLLETLKKENFYNTAPSGFNVNSNQIKDINAINILRLQYSLINDFLIRTKMTYTQNIFNNEIKSLIDSPIPFTDSEIIHNLNLNTKQFSVLRLNSNINTSPKDLVKSTYLYQLINLHCSLIRIDDEAQTMPIPEGDIRYLSPNAKNSLNEKKKVIDLDEEMKKIDDKYNKKLKLDEVLPFSKINEKKYLQYKEECDKRYEEQLKKEIDLFKNTELANMRLEENKRYSDLIESIEQKYKSIYDKKYEEIEKLKNELKGRKSNMEKEYEKKMYDLNESITEQLRNMREENRINNSKYLEEINNLNNEKKFLEQTIENLKDKHYNEMQSLKYDYQLELEKEKNVLKEDNEKNQKILLNNYTKNNNEISQLKNQINNINTLEKNLSKKELAPLKNTNNINLIKNSDLVAKMTEFTHKQRKILEDLEEEQNNLNKLGRFEFKNIMNEEPIVLLNQDEIDEIKRIEYYNNNINERDTQRKKSQEDIVYTNYNNSNISPNKNKQNQPSSSPIGIKNNTNINKSYLNNSYNKNININTSMRNSNIGIAGANYNNNINANKIGSGVIEENIDYENISSSQKSNKKSGSYNNFNNNNNNVQSNINNYNPNISRTNQTYKLPPINQNQTSYSIKEDIVESSSKSKSKIGNTSKKSNDNNINNINSNNLFNKSKDKFNNINYDKNDDDEYGEGDFENNISSLNQNSELNTTKKKSSNFGRIKNQNEASMSIREKIDKQSHMGMNDKESSDSYNDFENTKELIKKGINEGSNNFNNMSKYKNSNKNDSEIKEEIEYDNEF